VRPGQPGKLDGMRRSDFDVRRPVRSLHSRRLQARCERTHFDERVDLLATLLEHPIRSNKETTMRLYVCLAATPLSSRRLGSHGCAAASPRHGSDNNSTNSGRSRRARSSKRYRTAVVVDLGFDGQRIGYITSRVVTCSVVADVRCSRATAQCAIPLASYTRPRTCLHRQTGAIWRHHQRSARKQVLVVSLRQGTRTFSPKATSIRTWIVFGSVAMTSGCSRDGYRCGKCINFCHAAMKTDVQ
jgi:hypothetical protein